MTERLISVLGEEVPSVERVDTCACNLPAPNTNQSRSVPPKTWTHECKLTSPES